MINDPIYDHWREVSWRRKLTDAEQAQLRAWLEAHPEAQAEWEAETRLNAALDRLPDVAVPGNFTARVLQAAEREAAAAARRPESRWERWLRRHWFPKVAFATVVLGTALLSYNYFHAARLRGYANSLAAVSDVSSLPSPEVLRDFDAIRASAATALPDEQLLTALK